MILASRQLTESKYVKVKDASKYILSQKTEHNFGWVIPVDVNNCHWIVERQQDQYPQYIYL